MLEKLLSQSTEQDNPSRLVIEAAHGSASKVRELVQKYPDKVSAALLLFAAVHCLFQELFTSGLQAMGWSLIDLLSQKQQYYRLTFSSLSVLLCKNATQTQL